MEQEQGTANTGGADLPGKETVQGAKGVEIQERAGPTWRGFAISILVAIVLSVMATLLLGGSWSSFSLRPAAAGSSAGCGEGKSCCPLPPEEER
ncbi:MAG TPA: hypothetical protein VFF01_03420 [Candidatus Deferrimicrobiaceae bacterium]|nr:hypothetical protein [Candidatus Deferrimicrobiaceae bacterium]